jgi:hypothetical protein
MSIHRSLNAQAMRQRWLCHKEKEEQKKQNGRPGLHRDARFIFVK